MNTLIRAMKRMLHGYDLTSYDQVAAQNTCSICGERLTHEDGQSLIHRECRTLSVYGADAVWAWEHPNPQTQEK